MDKYAQKYEWQSENELSNTNYDNYPPISSITTIHSYKGSLKNSSSSKENVEVTLELEIAESHKDARNKNYQRGRGLDITIVEPLQNRENERYRCGVHPCKMRSFPSSVKREKLLEECKTKLKGNEDVECKEPDRVPHKLIVKKDECYRKGKSRNVYSKYKSTKKDIGVTSTPISPDNKSPINRKFDCLTGEGDIISRSVDAVKPIFGGIAHSMKEVEAKMVEIGDQKHKSKKHKKHNSISSDATNSDEYLFYKQRVTIPPLVVGDNAHKVYAAVKTFDHVRAALACQNPDINEQHKPDRPCLCQHCGMLGVLVDSQKRPVISESEEAVTDDFLKQKNESDIPQKTHWKNIINENIISDLYERVRILEIRLQEHEQRAVPRDYFKRVINKIVSYINPRYDHLLHFDHIPKPVKKTISTQCSTATSREDYKSRKRGRYAVHPVLMEQSNNLSCIRIDFKSDTTNTDKDGQKTSEKSSITESGNKISNIESFWKWGEEVIKPGFDLKDKIVTLLEEKLTNLKAAANANVKTEVKVKSDSNKTLFLKGSEETLKSNSIKKDPINKNGNPRLGVSENSGNNLKHLLDIMSAKIYNEYIQEKIKGDGPESKYQRDIKRAANDNTFKQTIQMQKGKLSSTYNKLRPTSRACSSKVVPEVLIRRNPELQSEALQEEKSYAESNNKNKSNIPIRKTGESCKPTPLKSDMQDRTSKENIVIKQYTKYNKTGSHVPVPVKTSSISKAKQARFVSNPLQVTYINPKANSWLEESNPVLNADKKDSPLKNNDINNTNLADTDKNEKRKDTGR